jgi:hypothetical protein
MNASYFTREDSSPNSQNTSITKRSGGANLSLETKYNLVTDNLTQRKLAAKYGISLGWVNHLLKIKNQIINKYEKSAETNNQNDYKTLCMETKVLEYYLELKNREVEVSGAQFKSKATECAQELGIVGFMASDYWLKNFKRRNSLWIRHEQKTDHEKMKNSVFTNKQNLEKIEKPPHTVSSHHDDEYEDEIAVDLDYKNLENNQDYDETNNAEFGAADYMLPLGETHFTNGNNFQDHENTSEELNTPKPYKKRKITPEKSNNNGYLDDDYLGEKKAVSSIEPEICYFDANLAVNKLIRFFTKRKNVDNVKKLFEIRANIQIMEEEENLNYMMQ